jgi:hypothetical protein
MLRNLILALGLCLLLATTATAQTAPKTRSVTLQYTAFWGGIEAARLGLSLREGAVDYDGQIDLRTVGMLKNLLRLQIIANSKGKFAKQTLIPTSYQYTSIRRKKTKGVAWVYDRKTRIARMPDHPGLEKIVPESWRQNVVDPIGATINAIRILRQQRGADSAALRAPMAVFDGRRRFDLQITGYERRELTVAQKTRKVIALTLAVTPKAGFDANDREGETWQSAKIELFLADDGLFYPIRAVASTSLGPAILQLSGGCIGTPPCAGGQEL